MISGTDERPGSPAAPRPSTAAPARLSPNVISGDDPRGRSARGGWPSARGAPARPRPRGSPGATPRAGSSTAGGMHRGAGGSRAAGSRSPTYGEPLAGPTSPDRSPRGRQPTPQQRLYRSQPRRERRLGARHVRPARHHHADDRLLRRDAHVDVDGRGPAVRNQLLAGHRQRDDRARCRRSAVPRGRAGSPLFGHLARRAVRHESPLPGEHEGEVCTGVGPDLLDDLFDGAHGARIRPFGSRRTSSWLGPLHLWHGRLEGGRPRAHRAAAASTEISPSFSLRTTASASSRVS